MKEIYLHPALFTVQSGLLSTSGVLMRQKLVSPYAIICILISITLSCSSFLGHLVCPSASCLSCISIVQWAPSQPHILMLPFTRANVHIHLKKKTSLSLLLFVLLPHEQWAFGIVILILTLPFSQANICSCSCPSSSSWTHTSIHFHPNIQPPVHTHPTSVNQVKYFKPQLEDMYKRLD